MVEREGAQGDRLAVVDALQDDTHAGGTTTLAANIQYDGTGQAISALLANGITLATAYDLSGQPSSKSGPPADSITNNTDNDIPTLPQWGSILLGSLLLMQVIRTQRRTQRRPEDRA